MMFALILLAIVYYLGFSLFRITNYRDQTNSSEVSLGSVSMIIYSILPLLSFRINRLLVLFLPK
jgi:hypothetical protein